MSKWLFAPTEGYVLPHICGYGAAESVQLVLGECVQSFNVKVLLQNKLGSRATVF